MMTRKVKASIAALVTTWLFTAAYATTATAQITSASVSGTIHDAQGGVVPGATVMLVSTTRNTRQEAVSGSQGEFAFPTVPADTYSLTVIMPGFKTVTMPGIVASPGDKLAMGTIRIDVGAIEETLTVEGHSPLLQTASAERSFSVEGQAIQSIAVNGRSFFGLAFNAPGIVQTGPPGGLGPQSNTLSANGLRPNQNNVQIDGITSMDTGSNQGPAVSLSIDAVQEIKVLTSNYQAEYGRSAGAQITAVTKSGSNKFLGSGYFVRRNDDLNANTWFNNQANPVIAVPPMQQRDYGYTLGGPLVMPGTKRSDAKMFFFAGQEFQKRLLPQTTPVRVKVPTAAERAGDFSQTLDNAGRPYPYIRDYTTGLPCSATDTRGCFQYNGVIGWIPPNRVYQVGMNVLKMYPQANSASTLDQGYNYVSQAGVEAPRRQDIIRIDWQPTSRLRVTGKLLQTGGPNVAPYGGGTIGFGTNIPDFGYTDPHRNNRGVSFTVASTLNNSTFFEITYGRSKNEFNSLPLSDTFNRTALGLSNFPMLYPGAVQLDLVPRFDWGGRVGANAPRNLTEYAPFLNENPTQDLAGNVTKTWSRHMVKTGVYTTRGFKPQSSRAPANGSVNFTNDASNPYDTGYPFANAATGTFSSYAQSAQWVQGQYLYWNVEWYAQDNWKVKDNLTFDYGVRFYWMQQTHEINGLTSNFLPDKFSPAAAPRLYYPALNSAGQRIAIDRLTGATQAAAYIGRIVPGSGTLMNGLFQAGQGIDPYGFLNPGIQVAPRFGFSWDVNGKQKVVVRGGAGIFYDRPTGDTVFGTIEQPPTVTTPTLFYGRLQDVNASSAVLAPPTLLAYNYSGTIPKTYAFNLGLQIQLPLNNVLDVSYVGTKGRDQLTQRNINAPAYGAAYLPQNQDPTLAPTTIPGANALPVDFLRPYPGFGNILIVEPSAWSDYHSLQTSLNHRFQKGLLFSFNYTLGKAMGTSSTDLPAGNNNPNPSVLGFPRNDANQAQANYMPLNFDRRHSIITTFVWQMPGPQRTDFIGKLANDWQLSGVIRRVSGDPYTPTFSIPGISAYTMTGTQGLEGARLILVGDPGSGHTDNPYQMFNTAAFKVPSPGSIGLESGLNYLVGPWINSLDLSVSKSIRLPDNRRIELRVDAFNTLNHTQFWQVNSVLTVRSLTDPTPTNLPYDANNNLVNRSGFGTVSSTRSPREVQLMARFYF
jgi:hypothetical protein